METPRASKSATDVGGYCSCIEYSASPGPLILTVCPVPPYASNCSLTNHTHTHVHTYGVLGLTPLVIVVASIVARI